MPDLTEIREALAKHKAARALMADTPTQSPMPTEWIGAGIYLGEFQANAPEWLAELCNQVERLTRERDAAYVLHDFEIKSGRECCPCGVAADKAIARAEAAGAAVERVRSLADWHEAKADKARRFPGAEVAIMEKAARVHEDAARRLRAALDEVSR